MTAPVPITSTANPRIKAAIALRQRSERDARGVTIVDGIRELRRALDARATFVEAFICPRLAVSTEAEVVIDALHDGGVPTTEVSDAVFTRLAFGERAEGVVGLVRVPPTGLDRLNLGANPLLVVLEAVEKPGNLGAVLRSADGAGADAVVLTDLRTDPFNPNAIRASVGTVFSVPIAVASGSDTRAWLTGAGIAIVAARVEAELSYPAVDLRGPTAIVLGAETSALDEAWAGPGVTSVRVPMHGVADSLNVSVTAAILLYEARRQRDEADDR